jgi:hypothetical protein
MEELVLDASGTAARAVADNSPTQDRTYPQHMSSLLRGTIGGGWIERVTSASLHALAPGRYYTVVMLVDEGGYDKHLPVNTRAWVFYPNARSAIVGDALLVGESQSNPEDHHFEDLPAHITCKSIAKKIQELQR